MSNSDEKTVCGIVMPLSAIDGLDSGHWAEVREIIEEAIENAGFEANLVSDAEDVGIIQKRIIQNLYENPIVVCDVSAKNPNVMFELGLRLAFDKPTIIVKDDRTSYSFDTAPIEHLGYPRDLRHSQIVAFQEKLTEKIQATHKAASCDPAYTTFLKHFGPLTVAKIDKKEVSGQEFILDQLQSIASGIQRLSTAQSKGIMRPIALVSRGDINACMQGVTVDEAEALAESVRALDGVDDVAIDNRSPTHQHIAVKLKQPDNEAPEDVLALLSPRSRNIRGMRNGRFIELFKKPPRQSGGGAKRT